MIIPFPNNDNRNTINKTNKKRFQTTIHTLRKKYLIYLRPLSSETLPRRLRADLTNVRETMCIVIELTRKIFYELKPLCMP